MALWSGRAAVSFSGEMEGAGWVAGLGLGLLGWSRQERRPMVGVRGWDLKNQLGAARTGWAYPRALGCLGS